MESGAPSEEQLPEYNFDPEKLDLRVRVTLAADRKSVDPVVAQVMESVRQMKNVDGKEDATELAVLEALANAVVHGAKEDPTKVVECIVAFDEQRGIPHHRARSWAGFRSPGNSQLHHGRES